MSFLSLPRCVRPAVLVLVCALPLSAQGPGIPFVPTPFTPDAFRPLSSFGVPGGVAEIVDATGDGLTLAYTDSDASEIGIVDITDPTAPRVVSAIPVNGEPTSVSMLRDYGVATVWTDQHEEGDPAPAFLPGELVVFDLAAPDRPVVLGTISLGWHPDSVKLVEVGSRLVAVVAIENEPVIVENGLVQDDDLPGNPNDVSPAGYVQVVDIDLLNLANSTVTDLRLPARMLRRAGCIYPDDPQPEFVAIDGATAAISLQENNGTAIVDISNPANPVLERVFNLGRASNRAADLAEDDAIRFFDVYPRDVSPLPTDGGGNPVPAGLRCPDALCFSPDGSRLFTADEGELNFTGGRGFSGWRLDGTQDFEDTVLELFAVAFGQYPEGRSENRGIEIEGIAAARFGARDFLFVMSERGSFMAIYRIDGGGTPRLHQILPTGISPEGIVTIPQRNLVVTADEDSGTLTFFRGIHGPYNPMQRMPTLFNPNLYRPFTAISGLAGSGGQVLYGIPDNAAPTQIYSIWSGMPWAILNNVLDVTINGTQARYDGEGIALDSSIAAPGRTAGWWIASEGDASSTPNLVVQTDFRGRVLREIQLPRSIDPAAEGSLGGTAQGPASGVTIRKNGFEGVTVSHAGRYLVVCIQREFSNEFPTGDKFTRIARYDLRQITQGTAPQSGRRFGGDWEFFFYRMDSNDEDNWAGLSEIVAYAPGKYLVIERDKGISIESRLKKVYAFSLIGVSPDADGVPDASDTVTKIEVVDVLRAFFPYEKIEGLALDGRGHLWIGLDNDGGEVEPRLVNTGPFIDPLP